MKFDKETLKTIRGFARSLSRKDADDLFQITLMKAWKYRHNFKEGSNLLGWLRTICRNSFIDMKRSEKLDKIIDFDFVTYTKGERNKGEEKLLYEEMEDLMRQVLTEMEYNLFQMYVAGASGEDISKATGVKATTVRPVIFRSKRKLRPFFIEYQNAI